MEHPCQNEEDTNSAKNRRYQVSDVRFHFTFSFCIETTCPFLSYLGRPRLSFHLRPIDTDRLRNVFDGVLSQILVLNGQFILNLLKGTSCYSATLNLYSIVQIN
jgi:hypothetical protein